MMSSSSVNPPNIYDPPEGIIHFDNDSWLLVIVVLTVFWLVLLTLPLLFLIEEVLETLHRRRIKVSPDGNPNEESMQEIDKDIEDEDIGANSDASIAEDMDSDTSLHR